MLGQFFSSNRHRIFIGQLAIALLVQTSTVWAQNTNHQSLQKYRDHRDPNVVARERESIRQQLKAVRENIVETNSKRALVNKELQAVEKSISESNLQLERLQLNNSRLKKEIDSINHDLTLTEQRIEQHEKRLANVLRSQHRRSYYNPMHTWLGGASQQTLAREAFWYEQISEAEAKLGENLKDELDELETLLSAKEERKEQIRRNENAQLKKKEVLIEQQAMRKHLVGQLNKHLISQQQEANRLERDEKRLSQLIDELSKAIEMARKKAERERALRIEAARIQAQTPNQNKKPKRTEIAPPTETPTHGEFARLKGQLELPVHGDIIGRFGQTRSGDRNGPSWRGIFIKSLHGTGVKAVATGRVVFAEWLRGFGQLIILDHGNQYMSIYGNNSRLNKLTGETVKTGEIIATVGDSSGNLENGLYFEIRYQGQPIDPLKWTTNR